MRLYKIKIPENIDVAHKILKGVSSIVPVVTRDNKYFVFRTDSPFIEDNSNKAIAEREKKIEKLLNTKLEGYEQL